MDVKLGDSRDFLFAEQLHGRWPSLHPLVRLGLETVALSARVAVHFGAQGGLLVVAVQPDSAAARAGVREGDIIESIDGRMVNGAVTWARLAESKHVLSIVRDRQRIQLAIETADKQEQ